MLLLTTIIAGLTFVGASFAQVGPAPKSELKVLFVGHNPDAPQIMFANMAVERTKQLYKERTPAFEAFLNSRFEHVTVVYGEQYTISMSDDVDVTIFDARPKPITASKREVDPETGEMDYQPASYLPLSFDRPALLIAENSPQIGEALGLKLDWL